MMASSSSEQSSKSDGKKECDVINFAYVDYKVNPIFKLHQLLVAPNIDVWRV